MSLYMIEIQNDIYSRLFQTYFKLKIQTDNYIVTLATVNYHMNPFKQSARHGSEYN